MSGIAEMLAICACEYVESREVGACAEIQIVVVGVVEHRIYCRYRRHSYGAWRQTCVAVCVVG